MTSFYILHDSCPKLKRKGAIQVDKSELKKYNEQGWGIFFTPNSFKERRRADCLDKINYWLADIDEGTKEEQMARINKLALKPSIIVETKKGYHCYWKAENATIEKYRDIELGLIDRLKADKACKDVSRILRLPNYYHMKDPANPYLIKVINKNDYTYTEQEMLFSFRLPKKVVKKIDYKGDKQDFLDETKWDKIFNLKQINEGGRNDNFARISLWLRDEGFDYNTVYNTIERMNQSISRPLDAWEIKMIVKSKF